MIMIMMMIIIITTIIIVVQLAQHSHVKYSWKV